MNIDAEPMVGCSFLGLVPTNELRHVCDVIKLSADKAFPNMQVNEGAVYTGNAYSKITLQTSNRVIMEFRFLETESDNDFKFYALDESEAGLLEHQKVFSYATKRWRDCFKKVPWHARVRFDKDKYGTTASTIGQHFKVHEGMSVIPGGKLNLEIKESRSLSNGGKDCGQSYQTTGSSFSEIIFHGVVDSTSWEAVCHQISLEVFALASGLSLFFDCRFRFSNAPETFPDQRLLYIPSDSTELEVCNQASTLFDNWESVYRKKWLVDSLNMYSEGLRLEEDHPTFALSAFVSSIEGVGKKLYPPQECNGLDGHHCESCQRKTGAMRAVLEALKLVMIESEAKRVRKLIYSPRSISLHESKLFGSEYSNGSMAISHTVDPNKPSSLGDTLNLGDAGAFRNNQVSTAKRAARTLLLYLVNPQLPEWERSHKTRILQSGSTRL